MKPNTKSIVPILSFLLLFPLLASDDEYFVRETDQKVFAEQSSRLLYGDPEEVADASLFFLYSKSNQSVRHLITALKGNDQLLVAKQNSPTIKFYTARALGKKGKTIAIKPLIDEYNQYQESIEDKTSQKKKLRDDVTLGTSLSSPQFFYEEDITLPLALGEMLRAVGSLPDSEESREFLKSQLKHKNYYLRASAAEGLALLKNKETLPGLKEALGSEKVEYTRAAILSSIVLIQNTIDNNYQELLGLLKSESSEVRALVSTTLGDLSFRNSEEPLLEAIDIEENPRIRSQMKRDLKRILDFKNPVVMGNGTGI